MNGDYYRYTPERTWCREGRALELESGRLLDTYWGTSGHDPMIDHYLSDDEKQTVELIGNVHDFEPFQVSGKHYNNAGFDGYEPHDRLVITSQHGLTRHLFVRKGSEPSDQAIIQKALADVSDALRKRDQAMDRVKSARDNLHFARTGRWPWQEATS